MLTGTDCAGKRNKPQAGEICLHHPGWGPGSRMWEAPAEDIFSCRGTKRISLQTGTPTGSSTKLRFHPGGTGGPETAAQPFCTVGSAGGTQHSHKLRASRGVSRSTHNIKSDSKKASHHHAPLPIPLSVCLYALPSPMFLFPSC